MMHFERIVEVFVKRSGSRLVKLCIALVLTIALPAALLPNVTYSNKRIPLSIDVLPRENRSFNFSQHSVETRGTYETSKTATSGSSRNDNMDNKLKTGNKSRLSSKNRETKTAMYQQTSKTITVKYTRISQRKDDKKSKGRDNNVTTLDEAGLPTKENLSCVTSSDEILKDRRYYFPRIETKLSRIPELRGKIHRVRPVMSNYDKETVRILLQELKKFCKIYKIENYFMFSGTLLGSYRHHGLQPWDDDVDLLMAQSQKKYILDSLGEYLAKTKRFAVTEKSVRIKFFDLTRSIPIDHHPHRWPFIDIAYYHENATHVCEIHSKCIQRSLVFPLHERPFETVMLNSPRDAFAVLKSFFKRPNCVALTFDHRNEFKIKDNTFAFDCKLLASVYPFVHRKSLGSCIEESLWVNNTRIYSVVVAEPAYAVSDPYELTVLQTI